MGGWSRLKGGIKGKVNAVKGHLKSGSSTCTDVALTSLNAIYDSADAFPPLKSAAGGVLALLKIAERVKASHKKAKALSERALQVFEALEKALPANRATIPPAMIASIKQFEDTIMDIRRALEPLTRQRLPFSRLNRNEAALDTLQRRLDDAYQTFTISAFTRIELETVATQRELQQSIRDQGTITQQLVQDRALDLDWSLQDQAALTRRTIKDQSAIVQQSIQDQEAITQQFIQYRVLDLHRSLLDQATLTQRTIKNSFTYLTISIGLF